MWRVYAVIGLVWLALVPPFFTNGACTAEFEGEVTKLQADIARLRTATAAEQYWTSRAVPMATISAAQCRQAKPRFLAHCGSGPLVYARVPVKNQLCRLYRDSEVKVQLQYDERG